MIRRTIPGDKELELIYAAQQNDTEALDVIINANMPLLRMLAGRFHVSPALTDELVQAGCVGFLQAIKRYRADMDAKLITYAVPWILGEMRRTIHTVNSHALLSLEACAANNEERCMEEILGSESIDLHRLDLRLALKTLQEDEKTLLYLRFFRDKTQKETAMLLNKSQSQVCKLERRVLDKLHALLA